MLPWRRASGTTMARRFRAPLAVLVVSVVALAALGMRDPFALAGTGAAIVLLFATLREYAIGARGLRTASGRSWPSALLGLFERDRRRYGGYLVHLGLGVMAIAVIGSNVYQEQARGIVAPGESFEVGGYTLEYTGLRQRSGGSNGIESEVVAVLDVREGDRLVGTMEPGRRFFANFPGQPMAIVDVDTGLREDLYVFLQGWDDAGVAEVNAFVNPLMAWLWIGAGVYVLGGIVAFVPQAAPQRATEAAPGRSPAATEGA